MNMGDAFDKESAAQSIFGRSWRELIPLFKTGRDEYQKLLEEQTVLSEEQVTKLGNVDDLFKSIEQEIQQMKNQFWAENADKIMELLQWLIDHKDAVVFALTAIAGSLAAMKIAEFAANLQKVVQGFKGLGLGGGAGGTGTGTGFGMGNAGGGAAGKGTGFLGTLGRIAPFAAPAALLIDGLIRDQQLVSEAQQRGAASAAEIGAKEQLFAGNPMFDSWKTLTDYMHVTGEPEDTQKAQEFAKHYLDWFNDDVQDRMLDELSKNMTYEEFDSFDEAMKALAEGAEHFYSDAEREAYTAPIMRAIEVMEQMMGGGQSGMTDTVEGLKGVPGQMVTAVQKGVSGIRVTLDGYAVGRLVAPYVSQEIARAVN